MSMTNSVSTIVRCVLIGAVLFAAATVWTQADATQVAKGTKVYTDKRCALCHKIRGKGGKIAGDLSTVGAKRDTQWLMTFMKNPKAVMPKAKMMPFRGSEKELNELVAYLSSLK